MTATTLPRDPARFDTTIRVGETTVRPIRLTDGQSAVELDHGDMGGRHIYIPTVACAVAAALQAVAVHAMEEPRQLRRSTEPGMPDQHGIGGGL